MREEGAGFPWFHSERERRGSWPVAPGQGPRRTANCSGTIRTAHDLRGCRNPQRMIIFPDGRGIVGQNSFRLGFPPSANDRSPPAPAVPEWPPNGRSRTRPHRAHGVLRRTRLGPVGREILSRATQPDKPHKHARKRPPTKMGMFCNADTLGVFPGRSPKNAKARAMPSQAFAKDEHCQPLAGGARIHISLCCRYEATSDMQE